MKMDPDALASPQTITRGLAVLHSEACERREEMDNEDDEGAHVGIISTRGKSRFLGQI
jgi:hypothetical protein